MSEANLERVRQDLATIQEAAGLVWPFGWVDVWQALALVPAGALLAAWAFFGPADYLVVGLVPLVLLAVVAGIRQLGKSEPATRREKVFSRASTLAVGAGLLIYFLWARQFGVVRGAPGSVACLFLGIMCLVLALSSPARRVYLAGTASLTPFGLVIPLCHDQQTVIAVGGLAVMVAGLAAAAILAGQLRTGPGRS
jgi:hypothetical protein